MAKITIEDNGELLEININGNVFKDVTVLIGDNEYTIKKKNIPMFTKSELDNMANELENLFGNVDTNNQNNTQQSTTSRRRRTTTSASDMIDKYRNM